MKRTPLVRKTPLARGTSQLRRTPMKPWRRKPEDKMDPAVHSTIINRDRLCFIYEFFDKEHRCATTFGMEHGPDALTLLTAEHIKINLRTGKRGDSRIETGVAMCGRGNVAVPSVKMRAAIRKRLTMLYPEFWAANKGDARVED